MSIKRILFVFLMILSCIQIAQANGPQLFVLTSDGIAPNNLYRVSLDTMDATKIGEIPYSGILWELAPASPGTAYTVNREDDRLFHINLLDAIILSSVQLDANMWINRRGLATSPNGTLFGIFSGWQLRTINPATGQTTFVANLSGISGGVESIAFASDGTLYGAASPSGNPYGSHLYIVDTISGQLSLIDRIGESYIDIDTLAYTSDSYLYGVDTLGIADTDLYRINTWNGIRTNLGILPGGVNGLLPEPATLCLLAVGGLAIMGGRHRIT